jgi:hypothetical protein
MDYIIKIRHFIVNTSSFTYVDKLYDKCLHPEKYITIEGYNENLEQYEKAIVKIRVNALEIFSKNNLESYALPAAECVNKKHTSLEKEQICEKLRPLFSFYPMSLDVVEKIAETMPESSYISFIQCYRAVQKKDWERIFTLLPTVPFSWRKDLIPEILKAGSLDESLEQWWNDLKLEDFQEVEKTIESNLPKGHPDKAAFLDQVREELDKRMPVYAPIIDLPQEKPDGGSCKIFFTAACICMIALGLFLQRSYDGKPFFSQ